MGYQDYTPMADKYLLPDGSIKTFSGVVVSGPNAEWALLYNQRAASAAKWLMPDGSIVSALPVDIKAFDFIQFDTTPVDVPTDIGTLSWDEQDNTLQLQLDHDVKIQIGQEMFIRAVNKTGNTIPNGSVVYVSGSLGNKPKIELADANSYINSMKVIGVATHDIAKNEYGFVTTSGIVRGLDTHLFNEGDCVFLSEVAGQYVVTAPADGIAKVRIGMIIKSHITDGWICVRVDNEKYMFGDVDNGNYSYFENDGTYVAKGLAITYRDEYVGGDYFVPSGATAPDIVDYTIGGVVTKKYSFDGSNTTEKLGNTFEIAHDIALAQVNAGTLPIEIHFHAGPSTIGTGIVRFVVDWCLIKANGAPIAGTQAIITKTITANQQYFNLLSGANLAVPAGGFGIGDLIEFTISRDPQNVGDTYAADMILYKVALHIPIDTLGSRTTYTK